jgi:predicted nucleic-acid-binding protein
VLRSRYGLRKAEILGVFSGLLESAELQIEGEPSVERALFIWKDYTAEFADCLIGLRHLEVGCQATASFDQRPIKLPA